MEDVQLLHVVNNMEYDDLNKNLVNILYKDTGRYPLRMYLKKEKPHLILISGSYITGKTTVAKLMQNNINEKTKVLSTD